MIYRWLVQPLLFFLPAETAHHWSLSALRWLHRLRLGRGVLSRALRPLPSECSVDALGLRFASPILLAAGFDKDASGYQALSALRFGGIEVGTVTAEAQPGNPRPRLFRLPRDRALLNRMGFNNAGANAAASRLRAARSTVVGVNIGKTKRVPEAEAASDYRASAAAVAAVADYVVVNVSSPNTPGLRSLQSVEKLRPILRAVQEALRDATSGKPPPLLVKLAPDLTDEEIAALAGLAVEVGLAGLIATNTTLDRSQLLERERSEALGAGGISGAPLKARSLAVLRLLRQHAGAQLVLVSVGGIETAEDAWERLQAGADLLQVYSGLVYDGPGLPRRLALGLLERSRAKGFASLSEALAARLESGGAPGPALPNDYGLAGGLSRGGAETAPARGE